MSPTFVAEISSQLDHARAMVDQGMRDNDPALVDAGLARWEELRELADRNDIYLGDPSLPLAS